MIIRGACYWAGETVPFNYPRNVERRAVMMKSNARRFVDPSERFNGDLLTSTI